MCVCVCVVCIPTQQECVWPISHVHWLEALCEFRVAQPAI